MDTNRSKAKLFCVCIVVQLIVSTSGLPEDNITNVAPSATGAPKDLEYEWSGWSSWSACSKTCGGGVSFQSRQCIPRNWTYTVNDTSSAPVVTVRVARQAHTEGHDCLGVDKRYQVCNTIPCPGGVSHTRAQQCSSYNRRPFRGQFYTWIPYIDGDAPCILNCRPLGQHFFASLALVADGTRCTKPGYNAMCVQGDCKIIGTEAILATAGTTDLRCGRRLVSGLFSRPRLPLGYSYVTTVPRGACRLNISEIIPNENFIALKLSNSSYIINGEFAISTPGTYDAAGTRFLYTRIASLDSVFAFGPTLHPIDIMILYTQPNPSIKYSYYTESQTGDVESDSDVRTLLPEGLPTMNTKHSRRHHPYSRPTSIPKQLDLSDEATSAEDDVEENIIGTRRFIWKISYNQCSRSCGGGMQVGKYRCVEAGPNGTEKDVSQIHCNGVSPPTKRRRCNNLNCPPRWRAAAWSECPSCGPATRTRIVGCVQDHSRGITKISDQKCQTQKPPTEEMCNIPDCALTNDGNKQLETKRTRIREDTEQFHDGPVYTLAYNGSENNIGNKRNYNNAAAAGWLFTEWSECVGWCVGGGIQTRGVRCADPSGCAPRKTPESSKKCDFKDPCVPHEGQWFIGEWSSCSANCGGLQVRGVLCVGGSGRHLRDSACKSPKPEHQRGCGDDCAPIWYFSDWSQCTGNCTTGTGIQRRTVWCAKSNKLNIDDNISSEVGAESETACSGPRPYTQRACELVDCPTAFPPELPIESQEQSDENARNSREDNVKDPVIKDCEDKLHNCALAVQARLCNYKYYLNNCCNSCKGR